MGSGRGRTRRAKATSPRVVPSKVVFHIKKWESFLAESNIGSQLVQQYYFPDGPPPKSGAITIATKLVEELLTDALAVGALPSPRLTSFDQIKVDIRTDHLQKEGIVIQLLKDGNLQREERCQMIKLSDYVGHDQTMRQAARLFKTRLLIAWGRML